MSTSTNSNVFFLFQTLPKKKLSTITVRRFYPHSASSNTRFLRLGLRCTAAGMSSVAPRWPSTAEAGSGGGGRQAVAPGGSSVIEGIAFIALVLFEYFVKIVASGIAFIALVVWMGIAFIALVVWMGYNAFVKIAVFGIGFIALVTWLGYQTFLTCLSKIGERKENLVQNIHMEDYKDNGHVIEKLGKVWIWEHIVGSPGFDSEQTHVLRSHVHSVLTQHPSTFDVKVHIEPAPAYHDQVRCTCKILAPTVKAFHNVEDELRIRINQTMRLIAT